ncbi:endonuclease [soil metagenome]
MKIKISFVFAVFFAGCLFAQHPAKPIARIAFWNVENLFDTINDPKIDDEEFLPEGRMKWTSERYLTKIDHLSKVILAMGNGTGPDILGMSEIENEGVLVDLTTKTPLSKQNYGIVHYDSPDKRGIDVGLIYKKDKFKVLNSKPVFVKLLDDSSFTRDILVVKGVFGKKDTLWICVNHWPSRRGGKEVSEERRMCASNTMRKIQDSIVRLSKNAKILVIGDFNDEPNNKSIENLKCSAEHSTSCFIDLMDSLKAAGDGSYHYRLEINMLDQMLISRSLQSGKGIIIYNANIFREDFMTGVNYKDDPPGPLHFYAGTRYIGGYSDHYPVYADVYLKK